MEYIEPQGDTLKTITLEITQEDLVLLSQQVRDMWQNVHEHDFKGCGGNSCSWCEFVSQLAPFSKYS